MSQAQFNAANLPKCVTRAERDEVMSSRIEWVRQLPTFLNLTAVECREIVAATHEKEFARRQTIFIEGAPCRQVLLILSGCVKTTQLGPSGCEVILRLSGPGELVGALELYLGSNNLVTARTTQPTTALVWDTTTFEAVSDRFPTLRRNTARLLGLRLQELEERFREISTQKVAPRLSHQLLRLSSQLRQHSKGALEISLSREELAQLTGTTLFTVSRLLSQWERLGIVSTRREGVIVRNLQALTELSETE
jgi:CRP-like cAMP-binding protein